MLSLKKTFSGGCAHGQAYSDMKRKYVHDLCAISVICSGRRVTVWLYSCDVDSPTLDQVELQPCHYSASVLHADQPAVMGGVPSEWRHQLRKLQLQGEQYCCSF